MQITLVIFSLSSGGAERVMSILANYWAERGEDVSLITIDSKENDFYKLDSRITRIALDLKQDSSTLWAGIKNNIVRVKQLRTTIKKTRPEVVISFMDKMSVVTLVATRWLPFPVIVSEHIDPRQMPPGGIWNLLRRWTYSWADAVVVLTKELREVLSEFVAENRLHVIPNPALPVKKNTDQTPPFELPSPFVVAMGRLSPQKGFEFLLEAFAGCQHEEWSLVILGEGSERERLESLSSQLGISSRVYLPGRVNEPSIVMHRADLFVLSSRFEGFPMVILEAMSCGLPVISFDCPTGPNEIINDGVDGVLVPAKDVDALAEAMRKLMDNESERKRIAQNAPKVVERFSLENVMKKWDSLMNDVIS